MASNKKIIISMSIIGLLLVSLAISYAYFSAKITNNESESTIVATAAYLELTFIDGSPEINASNILPGWSASKTFSVQNTGDSTAYYVLKITDINNPFVYGGISYKIESNDGGANVALDTLPLANMPVSGPIEIPVNNTHNYTITTYYNELEENQMQDLGKSFSYTVSIEAVYKKEIQYIEDLVDLSNEVNSGNKYEHTWFVLTRDLDFNSDESYKNANNTTTYGDYNGNGTVEAIKTELTTGRGFYPIGATGANTFYGSFDGQNHRLDNLYIQNNKSGIIVGTFGAVKNNVLRDLTISGTVKSTIGGNIGGIVGYSNNSVLHNLRNYVNVTNTNNNYNSTGGIIGTESNSYIRNCVNNGTISYGNYPGGLVGQNLNSIIIEKSINNGNVNGNVVHAAGLLSVTSFANGIKTEIYNSYNTGNISLANSGNSNTRIGGVIAEIRNQVLIKNTYNTGDITCTRPNSNESIYNIVGGLVGELYYGTIINSYNTGSITGGNRTGGIVGKKYPTANNLVINKCYNIGNITSSYSSSGYATSLGGIVGYPETSSTGKTLVLNSYNTGTINSLATSGGIFGRTNSSSYAINSYNTGNMFGLGASGIIGVIYRGNSYLNNTYSKSELTGSTSSNGLFYNDAGTPSVKNSYYLEGLSGSNVSGQAGTSLTAQYMASPEFVNLLNQNKRSIDLSTIYSGALSAYSSYELSDWKYDAEKGYPVLDN